MEDNVQVIVGIIVSVFLLFIFPVYMAYEKKDDIAYALTMRYTQEFVESVKTKGYITDDMLESYKKKLWATGNSFDVDMTHEYTRMDPITNYYKLNDGIYELVTTQTQEQRIKEENSWIEIAIADKFLPEYPTTEEKEAWIERTYSSVYGYAKVEDTYRYSKEVYTTEHIENVLRTEKKMWLNSSTEKFVCIDEVDEKVESTIEQVTDCVYAYTMNEGDTFNVTVKNTNTTAATVIYNMVTINTVDNNTRIYVNYGGEILNTQWYGKIDYTKMKDEALNLYNLTENYIADGEMFKFEGNASSPIFNTGITLNKTKGYIFECEVKPFITTELRPEKYSVKIEEQNLYNALAGSYDVNKGLFVLSVGINGIALVHKNEVILSYPITINKFIPIKLFVQKTGTKYKVVLYIDDVRVAESILVDSMPEIIEIGRAKLGSNFVYYSGYIRNIKIHN